MSWPTTSPASRGYGAAWKKLRQQVMQRDRYLCQTCLRKGRVTEATEVDHVRPKAQAGDDSMLNLAAICTPCHKVKSMREQGKTLRPQIALDGWPVE